MKKLTIILITLFAFQAIQSQTLIDTYKKGSINLIPDESYAKNTQWDKLFDDKDKIIYGNPVGKMKSLTVSKDGELFICNYSKYNVYKFDAAGNFVKEFGEKGGNSGEFLYRPTLHGILDDKYVFASDHHGRIQFYDLNGNFYKMVKIDYMPLQIIPLKDNKIAIWGHVPYNGDVKYIVSIKDINTGKEKIVDSYFNSRINLKPITIKLKEGGMISFSPSALRDKTILERTPEGNLIVGHNVEPKLSIYTTDGQKLKEIDLKQPPIETTQEDKDKFLESVKQHLIKKGLYEENKEVLNDPHIYPDKFPIYYSIKSDPEGNILIFNFTKTKGNSFLVYNQAGEFICETLIESDNLKLDINPRLNTFDIQKNGLYAFVSVVDSETNEVKIIRTKLK